MRTREPGAIAAATCSPETPALVTDAAVDEETGWQALDTVGRMSRRPVTPRVIAPRASAGTRRRWRRRVVAGPVGVPGRARCDRRPIRQILDNSVRSTWQDRRIS